MQIIKPFISNEYSYEFKKYGGFHTGVDIDIVNVTALASGVVTNIGKDSDGTAVTVQFDANTSLRYLHLKTVSVNTGAIINKGDTIGAADRFLHFEYIKPTKGNPAWPVRIGSVTHYKHDPTPIIDGSLVIDNTDAWYNNVNLGIEQFGDYADVAVAPSTNEDMIGSGFIR